MQVNEHAGQVRPGKRRPDLNLEFDDTDAKAHLQAKRPDTADSRRRTAPALTRKPPGYGAGF